MGLSISVKSYGLYSLDVVMVNPNFSFFLYHKP